MKAVYIMQQGDVDVLTYGDLPDPVPGPGEVLIRIRAAALNHIDVYQRSGGNRVRLGQVPRILGSDMAGEVATLGPGVTGVAVGQRILVNREVPCGKCPPCLEGRDDFCDHPRTVGGAYAQYAVAPAINCYPIPDAMSFEEAASIPLCFHGAWHCLVTRAQLRAGETLLITAVGSGVGSAGLQIAKALYARVLVTAGSDAKVQRAIELGAEDGINYTTTPKFSEWVLKKTGGNGADVIFDSVGAPIWDECFASMREGGRLVCTGVTGGHRANLHLGQLFIRALTLMGSGQRSRREFNDFMKLVSQGKLRGVVGRVFPLEQAREAHRAMEQRDFFGKIVLKVP